MKLYDAKKQCITYYFTKKNLENIKVFHRVFLQQMCTNQVLPVDLLTSLEDFLDRELFKNSVSAECWSIKLIVFMEPRITEKITVILALVFLVYFSQLCDSHKKQNSF